MDITKILPINPMPTAFENAANSIQAFSDPFGISGIASKFAATELPNMAGAFPTANILPDYFSKTLSIVDPQENVFSSLTSATEGITANVLKNVTPFLNIADVGVVNYPKVDIFANPTNDFSTLAGIGSLFNNYTSPGSSSFENIYKASDVITFPNDGLASLMTGVNTNNVLHTNLFPNMDSLGINGLASFEGSAALKIDPNGVGIASTNSLFTQLAANNMPASLVVMPDVGIANSCVVPKMSNVISFDNLTGINPLWNSAESIVIPSVKNEFESLGSFVNGIVDTDKVSSFMYGERASASYSYGDTEVVMGKKYVGGECHVTVNVYIQCVNFSGDIESELAVLGNDNNVEYIVIRK